VVVSATAEQHVLERDYEDVRVRSGRRSGLTVAVAVHRTVSGGIGETLIEIYTRASAGTNTLLAAKHLATERSTNGTGGFDGDDI
jgi:hypothetical protein